MADRFGFLIEVPDWSDLSEAERTQVLLDQFRGRHEFPVQVPALVERSAAIFQELCARPPAQLCGYFLALESQLRGAGIRFSSRRMTTLLRASLGIHASRIALSIESGEKSPRPEWQESLFLALAHGHPGLASGPVDRGASSAVAGFFDQAELAGLQVEDHVVGEEEREARVHVVVRFSRRIVLHVNVAGVDHRGGLELEEPCGSTPGGAGREFECQFVIQVADVLVRFVPGDKLGVLRREGLGAVLSVVQRGRRPGIRSIPTPWLLRGRLFL